LQTGDSAPTVLNAANEVSVRGFLDGRLGFLDIAAVVERTLEKMSITPLNGLEDVWRTDTEARRIAAGLFDQSL
jgi:1-deoxy-D-xylulose-5-phosphate reductoisomerase